MRLTSRCVRAVLVGAALTSAFAAAIIPTSASFSDSATANMSLGASGSVWKLLAAGNSSICALDVSNEAYCWGDNFYSALGAPTTTRFSGVPVAVDVSGALAGKTLSTVTTGGVHACAIDTAGLAYCWGDNFYSPLGTGAGMTAQPPTPVVTSGALAGKKLVQISGGSLHTCARDDTGIAYCWGYNGTGQIGNGNTTTQAVPVSLANAGALTGKTLASISAGGDSTCALDTAGLAYCWGQNTYGQLGDGSTTQRLSPVAVDVSGVLAGKKLVTIATGSGMACALDDSGGVYCWGQNSYGQLGDGTVTNRPSPVKVTTGALSGRTATQITVGTNAACAVRDDARVACWGTNMGGNLGDGTQVDSKIPVLASGALTGKTIASVTGGGLYACALDQAGKAYCWGSDGRGTLALGTEPERNLPVAVDTSGALAGKTVATIGSLASGSCALDTGGKLYCWGFNTYGQLGTGTTNTELLPAAAATGQTFAFVSPGGYHACGVNTSNVLLCWGSNMFGELGTGNNTSQSSPTPVDVSGALAGKSIVRLAGSTFSQCALDSAGKAYCWGANTSGVLGTGGAATTVPTPVVTTGALAGKKLVEIAMFGNTTCALDDAGLAYCWGAGTRGQLGNGGVTDSATPVAVSTAGVLAGKKLTRIAVGDYHACALDDVGVVYCWGSNGYGELGDGTTTDRSTPVRASGLLSGKNASSASVGTYASCVVAGGKGYCWGRGLGGVLGTGTLTDAWTPAAVADTGALAGVTLTAVKLVSGGSVLALSSTGQVYSWGSDGSGQLGIGTVLTQSSPRAALSPW